MHITEYLKKSGKTNNSSESHIFLNGNLPLLKETPLLDFSGIKFIDTVCLKGYGYNIVFPDLEEARDFEIHDYNKSLQADKLKIITSLGLSGCKSDISLPSLQHTYNLAMYNFSNKLDVPQLKSICQLYFDNKTQLTLASGQKLIRLNNYNKKEKGFGLNHISDGDFGGSVNAQARNGLYNVYGEKVYLYDSYYAYVDQVGPNIYEIIWNDDARVLLTQNGDSNKFIMLSGNKFFEGKTISECREKYNKWKDTIFINSFKLEHSVGQTMLSSGKCGQPLYITAFYSDGTLAANREPVGMDEKLAQEKLAKLKKIENLTIHQFKVICLESRQNNI